jgi:Sulfotransferase family
MVQVMLHGHRRIAIPPENRFVLSLYRERLRFGNLEERANRRAVARFIVARGRRFRHFGLDRREIVARIVEGPPTLGSAIGTVLSAYAERFDKPRWGDKRPHYTHHLDALLRLFPDAQIVHVVRDPRDCVASLKEMSWWKGTTYDAVSLWAEAIDHVQEASRRWPGVVVPVRYERLVADPEAELRTLCAALGEHYDDAMAAPERVADVAVPKRKHWHENTRRAPTTERIGRWQEALEPWEAALCETVLGDRMVELGYETAGTDRAGAEHRLRYARTHTQRGLARRAWRLRDAWIRRREPNGVAALLTSSQRAGASPSEVFK